MCASTNTPTRRWCWTLGQLVQVAYRIAGREVEDLSLGSTGIHVAASRRVFRLSLVLLVGCDGVLHEKTGADVDASALGQIPTPACDPQVAAPSDGHHFAGEDCLGCHH